MKRGSLARRQEVKRSGFNGRGRNMGLVPPRTHSCHTVQARVFESWCAWRCLVRFVHASGIRTTEGGIDRSTEIITTCGIPDPTM